jgi:hypothetical protein
MFYEVEIPVLVVQEVFAKGRCVTVTGPVRSSSTEDEDEPSFRRRAFGRDGGFPL